MPVRMQPDRGSADRGAWATIFSETCREKAKRARRKARVLKPTGKDAEQTIDRDGSTDGNWLLYENAPTASLKVIPATRIGSRKIPSGSF
jgi:hypothetical protein